MYYDRALCSYVLRAHDMVRKSWLRSHIFTFSTFLKIILKIGEYAYYVR